MTHLCRVLALVAAAVALSCAGGQRLEQIQKLSDDQKELFSKYQQFMTEGQKDEFLGLASDEARQQYVAGLHVEERLAKYPDYIQQAIWAQEVVPGMDRAAVLLTWSTPELREWDEAELSRGNEVERWSYRRYGEYVQVVLANGVVTAVERAETKQ